MNKDVIYIEPEDDITDIIGKLKASAQKVVAFVPPKKIGVLRSAVNIKLIAKTAKTIEKLVVIVTTDSALAKLALSADLPVAKNLSSRPVVPGEPEALAFEQELEQTEIVKPAAKTTKAAKSSDKTPLETTPSTELEPEATLDARKSPTANTSDLELSDLELEEEAAQIEKERTKKKKHKTEKVPELNRSKLKIIAFGIILLIALSGAIIWATIFAPAVQIAVKIRTTANNFSENATFTQKASEEDATKGLFMLEEKKLVKESKVEIKPTGQKDVGAKAEGKLTVYYDFATIGTLTIPAGTKFTYEDFAYRSVADVTLEAKRSDGRCEKNAGPFDPCRKSTSVAVVAVESGDKYNISGKKEGWKSSDGRLGVTESTPMAGGTSKIITTIQPSDVTKAKELLGSVNEAEGKTELFQSVSKTNLLVEASYKAQTAEPVVKPAVGEEVKEEDKPELKAVTTFTVFTIDKVRIEEYIRKLTEEKMADDQKVYKIKDVFIERFTKDEKGVYSAKIKASTESGPKITEQEIMEKSKGRKIGEVQSLIKSINGISVVKINTSYPWVTAVPNDYNKITIEVKVEE